MHIGYARVSTQDQDLSLQYDALRQAQCDKIYEDKASGAHASRHGLTLALDVLRENGVEPRAVRGGAYRPCRFPAFHSRFRELQCLRLAGLD